MNERNPSLALFLLFVGCFATVSALFIAWNEFERFIFLSLTLISLGVMMFSLAVLNALPEGPSRSRKVVRVVGVVLSVATISLIITALMDELFYR